LKQELATVLDELVWDILTPNTMETLGYNTRPTTAIHTPHKYHQFRTKYYNYHGDSYFTRIEPSLEFIMLTKSGVGIMGGYKRRNGITE